MRLIGFCGCGRAKRACCSRRSASASPALRNESQRSQRKREIIEASKFRYPVDETSSILSNGFNIRRDVGNVRVAERMPCGGVFKPRRLVGLAGEFGGDAGSGGGVVVDAAVRVRGPQIPGLKPLFS